MAKPKLPSQKSLYKSLNKRLAVYVTLVHNLYDRYNLKAAQIALDAGYEGDGEFHFDDDAVSRKLIRDVQRDFVDDMQSIIYSGITKEWRESNRIQDLIADKVLSFYDVTNKKGEKYRRYYQTDSGAYRAFNARRDRGLNLSKTLWSQAEDYKTALEETISLSIQKGTSAITLSKKISQYLKDFDKIRDDYTERFGKASRVKNCEYRSIRLARSEINMAYRTAEQERWKRMDFILGYEIKLSKAHKHEDICDCLAGKYPKDFKWTGWHPNDMCYAVPIIMSDEEFWGFDEDGNDVEATPNYVDDVPIGMKQWVTSHKSYIKFAESRGTLPYFYSQNNGTLSKYLSYGQKRQAKDMVKMAHVVGQDVQTLAEGIAQRYGGVVTPINYKSEASIIRKTTTEGISPYSLKDAVRTTIVVDNGEIEKVLKDLENSPSFVRMKRQTPDKFDGYSGNIVNVSTSNGVIGEIQVNTAKMIYAKEPPAIARAIIGDDVYDSIAKEVMVEGGLGHRYYEQIRVLNRDIPDELEKMIDLTKKMRAYYSIFQ